MKVVIDNYEQFKSLKDKGEVLIDFFATWCGPCKMIAPIVDELAEEIDGLTVLSVDVDEVPQAAAEFGVSAIPTLVYCKDGATVNTSLGYAPKPKLLKLIGR